MSLSASTALLTRIRVRESGFGVSRCGLQSAEACQALVVMASFVNRPAAVLGIVSMKRELDRDISRLDGVRNSRRGDPFANWYVAQNWNQSRCGTLKTSGGSRDQPCGTRSEREFGCRSRIGAVDDSCREVG